MPRVRENFLHVTHNELKHSFLCFCTMNSANSLVLLIAAVAVLSVGAASTALAANPNTDNPSGWGKLTSRSATTDQGSIGDHASSQDSPRLGLGNVLGALTDNPDASKHPSELGEFLCTTFPGTSPCPPVP